ncbi:MAG: metallophosphoesterase family protein [Puniceicoccales bacterium]|nr:metallophosphoesterase family protein [Puniceicoccales bacterium]
MAIVLGVVLATNAVCATGGVVAQTKQTPTPASPKPVLRFRADGTFKIVQFTDTHYQIRNGKNGKSLVGTEETLAHLREALEAERPDLVVFTGDNVLTRPQKRGWDDLLDVPERLGIPYAVVLGNHDDEHDWNRVQILQYVSAKPHCLAVRGPAELPGAGNYALPIGGKDGATADAATTATAPAAVVYCFDSHSYRRVGKKRFPGYDYIRVEQVAWYRGQSAAFTQANGGKPLPALAFFHIPLQEYALLHVPADKGRYAGAERFYASKSPVFGTVTKKPGAGWLNGGAFAAFVECGDVMGVFVGHDHNNDYVGSHNGVALGFGRCGGHIKSTNNHLGLGSRVFVLREGKREFETWLREASGKTLWRVSFPKSFASASPSKI